MQRLYNDYQAMNALGQEISERACAFVEQIVADYPGVDLRDLGGVVTSSVDVVIAERVLRFALARRKAEQKAERTQINASKE